MKPVRLIAIVAVVVAMSAEVHAQTANPPQGEPDVETLKKANDPMADVKAFNIQNYIVSSLYGSPGRSMNQLLFRYSQPAGNVLFRFTMPFVTSSTTNAGPVSGLGDFNMFAIYAFPSTNGNKFGIGSLLVAPTATQGLGQGKWQTGISALAFLAKSRFVQAGSLFQYQFSVAGDDTRNDVSLMIPQIFFFWQIGGGFNIRSTGVWSFDLTNGHYSVPVGFGVGKVVKVGKTVFNLFAEPQFTVLAEGAGQPKYQTFVGFNTQF